MFIILIGIYLFFLTCIIGFLVVTKIHVYKFKNFSENIEKYTKIIFTLISGLTLVCLIVIFMIQANKNENRVDEATSTESVYY